MKRFIYLNPVSFLIIALFVIILILMIPFLFIGIIGGALSKPGFGFFGIVLILAATIAGSFINIPVLNIRSGSEVVRVPHGRLADSRYRPVVSGGTTVVAVNVGGAVVPLIVSLYLIYSGFISGGGTVLLYALFAGIIVVAVISNISAKSVRGRGIGFSFLIPPLAALICALLLSTAVSGFAPVIAYVSGTLGIIIGADLLNIRKMAGRGADMIPVGGAGTFDGVFLTGIIAALLA